MERTEHTSYRGMLTVHNRPISAFLPFSGDLNHPTEPSLTEACEVYAKLTGAKYLKDGVETGAVALRVVALREW